MSIKNHQVYQAALLQVSRLKEKISQNKISNLKLSSLASSGSVASILSEEIKTDSGAFEY